MVARRHLVEPVAVVGDDPREDVDAPGRALGVGLAPQPGREVESLLQLNQVRAARLEHGAVATEVDLVEDVVLQLALDRVGPGQEAAADAQGPLAQAEVEAGRLHVGFGDLEAPGVDVAGADGPLEELPGQHPFGRGVEVQPPEPPWSPDRVRHAQSKARGVPDAERPGWGRRRAQPVDDLGRTRQTQGFSQGRIALSTGRAGHGLRCPARPPRRAKDRGRIVTISTDRLLGFVVERASEVSARAFPGDGERRVTRCHQLTRICRTTTRATGKLGLRGRGAPDPPDRHRRGPEESADVERTGRRRRSGPGGTTSRWSSRPLTYARGVLAADVAILRHCLATATPSSKEWSTTCPARLSARSWGRAGRPPTTDDRCDLEMDEDLFARIGPLAGRPPGDGHAWTCRRVEVHGVPWPCSRSSWPPWHERHEAVEARLQQIRPPSSASTRRGRPHAEPARLSSRPGAGLGVRRPRARIS